MCYIINAVIISDADKIQFGGDRRENQKFILYNAWKVVKLTKMVKKVKVIKTVEISQIDQDGEDQEPNDQPATSSIYLSRQGLVATLVAARTDFSTFEDQRQQKFYFRGFWRLPSLF